MEISFDEIVEEGVDMATKLLVDFAINKNMSISQINDENVRRRPLDTTNISVYLSEIGLRNQYTGHVNRRHNRVRIYAGALYSGLDHRAGMRRRVTAKQSGGGRRNFSSRNRPKANTGCREMKYITELFQTYGRESFNVIRTAVAITNFHVSTLNADSLEQ